MPEKKRDVTVEIDNTPPLRAVYANRYFLEQDGEHLIFHFGYRGDACAPEETVAVCVSHHDLRVQLGSWDEYISKVSAAMEVEPFSQNNILKSFNPCHIEAANMLRVARVANMGEITFATFVLHEVATPPPPGSGNVKAHPRLMVRTSLSLQFDLLCKLLEKFQPPEE